MSLNQLEIILSNTKLFVYLYEFEHLPSLKLVDGGLERHPLLSIDERSTAVLDEMSTRRDPSESLKGRLGLAGRRRSEAAAAATAAAEVGGHWVHPGGQGETNDGTEGTANGWLEPRRNWTAVELG